LNVYNLKKNFLTDIQPFPWRYAMNRMLLTVPVFVACLILTVTAVPSGFSTPTINVVWPLEWGGVWEGQSRTYICEEATTPWETSGETICGGTFIDPAITGDVMWDVGALNATAVNITATATVTHYENCFKTTTMNMVANRNGNSMTGTIVVRENFAGPAIGCDAISPTCWHMDIEADRTGPEPGTCVAAVEPVTWGHVKSIYE
jgi:hypothetical protein